MEPMALAGAIISPVVTAFLGWLTPKQSKKVQHAGKASATALKESGKVLDDVADGKVSAKEAANMASKAKKTYEWARDQFGEDEED